MRDTANYSSLEEGHVLMETDDEDHKRGVIFQQVVPETKCKLMKQKERQIKSNCS